LVESTLIVTKGIAMGIRIWVDDERPMPPGYDIHIKTLNGLVVFLWSCTALMAREIEEISFDNDMPALDDTFKDVYSTIKWFAYNDRGIIGIKTLSKVKVNVHSANPLAKKNIMSIFETLRKV
jgi:hypothetical protein